MNSIWILHVGGIDCVAPSFSAQWPDPSLPSKHQWHPATSMQLPSELTTLHLSLWLEPFEVVTMIVGTTTTRNRAKETLATTAMMISTLGLLYHSSSSIGPWLIKGLVSSIARWWWCSLEVALSVEPCCNSDIEELGVKYWCMYLLINSCHVSSLIQWW